MDWPEGLYQMKYEKGEAIARIMQWSWNAGLSVKFDHKKINFSYPDERRKEYSWPVIRFSNWITDRHQEITAKDFSELLNILDYTHKKIFADLGCPEFPKE